ncbi:c-type cytochrome [Pontibacter beigongshangensis]|uniref:c-type cytochrome n=1 Tax=Pontibacter beigongshangensis TaxID=2574733 RepID=UPI00164F248A|nr:c-type cytochrome [Pontibacter beigongshangensis]
MKKTFLIFSCCALLAACNEKPSEYSKFYEREYRDSVAAARAANPDAGTPAAKAPAEPAIPENPYDKGAKLIAKSDCLACHQEQKKVLGPSYVDVANKYEFNDENVEYLADKIIAGGAGVWGEIPMSPHQNLSKEDAAEMAKYVLSLRN